MKTYAKLEDGALRVMGRVPNISNPTDAQVAAYAAAHGFKELVAVEPPGRYYRKGYAETEDAITETWTAWELDAAKKDALKEIQSKRDAAMQNVVIPCNDLPNGILYNTEASVYALGLSASPTLEGETWTDAADETHELTAELLSSIIIAMKAHIKTVQDGARPYRDAIRAADNVDEIERILSN